MAYHQKRQEPTRFPYVTEVRVHTGVSQIAFPASFATAEAFVAFKMNAKNLDAIALRDRAKEVREAGLTVDDIKSVVKDGATFIAKVELEHDTDSEVPCVRCLKSFMPVRKPRANGGFSGNFRTLKAEEVAKLDESRQRIATETTAWVLGVEAEAMPADLKTRAVPICPECRKIEIGALVREEERMKREGLDRKPFFHQYFVIADVQDALYERDSKITNAINRKTYDEVVGPRGNRRPATENRGENGRGDRPRGPRKAWHGVELFPSVADTLSRLVTEGKLGDSLESLLAMAPAELEMLGLQNAVKVQQLAQSHADWAAREAKKNDFAHRGRVTLGDAVARS